MRFVILAGLNLARCLLRLVVWGKWASAEPICERGLAWHIGDFAFSMHGFLYPNMVSSIVNFSCTCMSFINFEAGVGVSSPARLLDHRPGSSRLSGDLRAAQ